jgi:hypothetical protein
MSAKQRIKNAWETVTGDPNVLSGTVQVITAIAALVVAALTRKKSPPLKSI